MTRLLFYEISGDVTKFLFYAHGEGVTGFCFMSLVVV